MVGQIFRMDIVLSLYRDLHALMFWFLLLFVVRPLSFRKSFRGSRDSLQVVGMATVSFNPKPSSQYNLKKSCIPVLLCSTEGAYSNRFDLRVSQINPYAPNS